MCKPNDLWLAAGLLGLCIAATISMFLGEPGFALMVIFVIVGLCFHRAWIA